jgi:hypothetical protein
MDSTVVMLTWIFAGAIGSGFMLYGKKQGRIMPFAAGLMLMVYPMVVDKPWMLITIGIVLVILPFIFRF